MNFYANIMENKGPVIGDSYFLQTKEEIENWLNQYAIEKYTINDNLTVDVNESVDISFKSLTKIPIKFNKIKGSFDCSNNKLTSLKGCPEFLSNYFKCSTNKLESLEYSPEEVGGYYDCHENSELTSLKYSPNKVVGSFYCHRCKLTSLEHCPKIINGIFRCGYNELETLEYFPIECYPFISNNPIKTLKGLENISVDLLIALIKSYPKLSWRNIEWDKVKNIDEIVTELYKNIEEHNDTKESEEALKRIEELQLY